MGILAGVLNLCPSENNCLKYLDVLLCWWGWISVGERTKRECKRADFRTLGNSVIWGTGRKTESSREEQ